MSQTDQHGIDDEFVSNLTKCQNRLYVYILSLLPDPEKARDILQETNIVLWRKANDFELGSSFGAWACKVAYYEVLAERRKLHRDRHFFNEALLATLAADIEPRLTELDQRSVALDECLERLTEKQRQQLMDRYSPGGSVSSVAEAAGESRGAIATTLYRIRSMLQDCIRSKVAKGMA